MRNNEYYEKLEEESLMRLSMLEDERIRRRRQSGIDYYVPNAMQKKAHQSNARTILYSGGNRAGKTHFGSAELTYHLTRKYPDWFSKVRRFKGPIKAVISATEFPVITRVIEPKIKRLLPENYYKIVRRGGYMSRIECIDGSTVDILTLEMANEAYESADWDFFWGDEPQSKTKFEGVLRGLIDRRGLAILTFTPLTEPWMKEDLIDRADGKTIEVFQVRMRDNMQDIEGNAILSEESISEFERMVSEDTRETRLGGVFFHLRGAIYKEFGEAHIMDDIKYEYPDPVICVLDPHDRLAHHVIWAFIDKNDDVFVDYESVVRCELEDLAKHITRIERERGYRVKKRIIDPNFGRKPYAPGGNLSVMQELARYGCPFYEGMDDKELGHMIVREYLHWDSSRPLTALNMPKVFFSRSRCPVTIRSMKNLQYEDWSGVTKDRKNPKEVEQDKENHGADTVRYLLVSKPRFSALRESRDTEKELESAPY